MKRVFYIFIFLISILFVFSCSSSMRSINEHLSDKGLLASYQKEADNAGNVKSKNRTFMRFYKEPKYFVLGLIEWGYFLDMNYTLSNKTRKKLYKKQASKLGNYYRVVFSMYK